VDEEDLTLELFYSTVEHRIRDQFPALRTVATWPDIRDHVSLPALFLEIAEFEPGTDPGTGRVGLECRLEAYIILASEEPRCRHMAAQMATQLIVLLRAQYWGLPDVDAAEFVQSGPDWTKPELDGYTVWKVEWTQQIYLGEEQWTWDDGAHELIWNVDVVAG